MKLCNYACVPPIVLAVAVTCLFTAACSPGSSGTIGTANGSGSGGGQVTFILPTSTAGGASGAPTGGFSQTPPGVWPPPGFINVTDASYGAYALGPPLSSFGGSSGGGGTGGAPGACSGLYGVLRDFKMSTQGGSNPDFEHPPADDHGIVANTLGSDGKPVYANPNGTTPTTHGKDMFDQWYRDVDGVNMSFLVGLHFVPNGNVYTFAATINSAGAAPNISYFPLDGQGFGNQGENHNFSFTTEIQTSFTYHGGEIFTFAGDDDVWVFINDKLAIDLGGIHLQETQTVDLDAQASNLGISKGNVYPLAVFNAERHVVQSNFRIDTTLVFNDCGQTGGTAIIP